MHNVDFIIVGVYLIVMFAIGLLMKGKAGQSITSYFVCLLYTSDAADES